MCFIGCVTRNYTLLLFEAHLVMPHRLKLNHIGPQRIITCRLAVVYHGLQNLAIMTLSINHQYVSAAEIEHTSQSRDCFLDDDPLIGLRPHPAPFPPASKLFRTFPNEPVLVQSSWPAT